MHLSPKMLLGKGGTVTCAPERIVNEHHFFLVIAADAKRCRLVPLYTEPGGGRLTISDAGRTGHTKWTTGVCHYHPEQVWEASKQAVIQAAKAGNDQSSPGNRNLLDPTFVPAV